MNKAIVYIHGKNGSASESQHFAKLCKNYDVIGFDYKSATPWEAKSEFVKFFDQIFRKYNSVSIIANSIGAYFAMISLCNKTIDCSCFISPIVDMEELICNMMSWANVSNVDLMREKTIKTEFGETLSWEYYTFSKNNPVQWTNKTYLLYGENDNLTSFDTISNFAKKTSANLSVMPKGEHWFHTKKQMQYLDKWILSIFG